MSINDIRTLRFEVLGDRRRVRVALPERLALAPNRGKLGVYQEIMPTLAEVASIASVGPVEIVDPIHAVFVQYYE